MSTTAIHKKASKMGNKADQQPEQQLISWEEFEREYLTREDGYRYEWLNGLIEKTKYTMDGTQLYILHNLQEIFRRLLSEKKVYGDLLAEPDLFFAGIHRRPDVAWLTIEQIFRLADKVKETPAFVIEVISNHDAMKKVNRKMADYRNGGVQVAWLIFPETKEVHVYAGKNLKTSTICLDGDQCSAAPILPGFKVAVNDIFNIIEPAK